MSEVHPLHAAVEDVHDEQVGEHEEEKKKTMTPVIRWATQDHMPS